ncbi:MAG: hypothetical protein B7Y25_02865 [Alphaproteobacteria bacterium 16-39-46]|nr:MAG: hypothetical protein B7Y25_02865 [Alphaproteobacteria bacterium 16-39-46]OZA43483.1 MAG: hypothetical protein B7X84_03140 [Alphaproteobacteria bacterium 17-39-52]
MNLNKKISRERVIFERLKEEKSLIMKIFTPFFEKLLIKSTILDLKSSLNNIFRQEFFLN